MIGSNFEIAEQDITRVEWIQSDGNAYIDLEYVVARDKEISSRRNMLEVDFSVLNGVNNAPGYVFGTRTSEGVEEMALKIEADHVPYYRALSDADVNMIWSDDGKTKRQLGGGYAGIGSISTNIEGQITSFTVRHFEIGRVVGGSLVWFVDKFGTYKTTSIKYPLTSVEECFPYDDPIGITIINPYLYHNSRLGYYESFNIETGEVIIWDSSKNMTNDPPDWSWRYAYPELRETYTQWENHRATADCANAHSRAISGDNISSNPLITDGGAYIANGCRHKVMLREFDGHWLEEALWFDYIIDRQFFVASEPVLWVTCNSYSPNTVFLFAKNDGLLNPIGVNPSMRVYGLKCITITGGSTLAPEVECTRNLIPAVKAGVGAGLYDIIAGKFYPAKGGTMLYGGIVA